MICRFNFFATEVPITKKPVHWSAEHVVSKIYRENQVVYYFGKSIDRQSRGSSDSKKNLISTLNIMGGILCLDIISKRSKI